MAFKNWEWGDVPLVYITPDAYDLHLDVENIRTPWKHTNSSLMETATIYKILERG